MICISPPEEPNKSMLVCLLLTVMFQFYIGKCQAEVNEKHLYKGYMGISGSRNNRRDLLQEEHFLCSTVSYEEQIKPVIYNVATRLTLL